jgi:hypothetical protein
MTDEAPKPVINEARDEVRLGDLTLKYDRQNSQLEVGRRSQIDDAEVFALGDGCSPELWESFVKDLEDKVMTGLPLATLQRIREMGRDAKRIKGQEERGERGSKALQPGVEAFMQLGIRVEALVNQVLEEFERTSPHHEDESHVSMLDGSTSPRGVAPEEIMDCLRQEAACVDGQVTVLNWSVTEAHGKRVIFVLFSHEEPQREDSTRVRTATYLDGECLTSGTVL